MDGNCFCGYICFFRSFLWVAGLFIGKVGGYLLFRTESYEETQALIEKDPYIVNGVRDFEIESWDVSPFPLKVTE